VSLVDEGNTMWSMAGDTDSGQPRAGVHVPIKSVSVPAPISFFPPGLPYTQTDKIAIGACKAVSFVSDAEQSTWLPCGIGVFIFCVCLLREFLPLMEMRYV